MEVIKKRIEKNVVNIYHITDTHTGSENQRTDKLKEFINIIKNDKDGYWVGGGDFVEAIVMSDPRFSPGELQKKYHLKDLIDLPRVQMKEFFKLIEPIKEKCIGLLIGNHEEQYIRHNHFNVMDYLASDLMGHPELKMGHDGYILLTTGSGGTKRQTKIFATHGEGISGSPRDGAVIDSFIALCADKDADIYLGGHVHRLLESSINIQTIDTNGNVVYRQKTFCVGGAWLDKYHIGTSGYFESKKGYETMAGYIVNSIIISGGSHQRVIKTSKHTL